MSKDRIDNRVTSPDPQRAIMFLGDVLAIVDKLDKPELGARIQEVIDALHRDYSAK
jgi:hypothetical protein